jgi:hypothetical protein
MEKDLLFLAQYKQSQWTFDQVIHNYTTIRKIINDAESILKHWVDDIKNDDISIDQIVKKYLFANAIDPLVYVNKAIERYFFDLSSNYMNTILVWGRLCHMFTEKIVLDQTIEISHRYRQVDCVIASILYVYSVLQGHFFTNLADMVWVYIGWTRDLANALDVYCSNEMYINFSLQKMLQNFRLIPHHMYHHARVTMTSFESLL